MPATRVPTGSVAVPRLAIPTLTGSADGDAGRTRYLDRKSMWWAGVVGLLLWVWGGVVWLDRVPSVPRAPAAVPALASFTAPKPAVRSDLAEYVRWSGKVPVQETAEAMIVRPIVTEDPVGGLLVADSRESQVRRLSFAGSLLGFFGRPGDGPREFRSLTGAVRLRNGDLLTTEISGRVTLLDGEGSTVKRSEFVPIQPLYAATVLDDSTVILTGRSEEGAQPVRLVHLWDPRRWEIRASLYEVPEHAPEFASAYSFSGQTAVAVRDGIIAVLFGLGDHVRLFRADGTEVDAVRIPYRHFRRLSRPRPANSTPEEFRQWAESYSVGSRLYWLSDESFVIQYFDRSGSEQKWSMLHMDRRGRPLFEGPTPKLLTILHADTTPQLLFEAADHEEPNQWRLASFKQSSF